MIAFPASETPDVSVVVLVTREPALVGPTLEAIAAALPRDVATETVLLLNTTSEDTRALVRDGVRGARVIASPVNCGTAVGWNVAFAAARGRDVALLHEDSLPRPGWLEALLDAAAAHPRAFVVTGRLLKPDGTVGNGGWVVWSDGWTTTLDERSAPRLVGGTEPYLVDRTSSASSLIERAAWETIGGFDESTFPAVTTDLDLGLAGWRTGRTAIATPRSVVVHATQAMVHGGRGLYSGPLFREFLIARGTKVMQEKWADVLAGHAQRGDTDPSGDPDRHAVALAATEARAALPPPAPPPTSRQDRKLSAPDGGWPTEVDPAMADRLVEAQREVDARFDAWVLDDREQLRARILELDAGAREATQAHDNAIAERDHWKAQALRADR